MFYLQFINHILEIFAFFMLTGIFSTMLIPETKQRSLEDISNENQENFIQGVAGRHLEDAEGGVSVTEKR